MISWIEIIGFCWINSYFDHPDRGTWYNNRNNLWDEIDAFIRTKEERIKMVRRIATDSEFTLSDHKPKTMRIIDEGPKCKKSKQRENVRKIGWQKLDNTSMTLKFQEEMRTSMNTARQDSKGISLDRLSRTLKEVGENTAGLKTNREPESLFSWAGKRDKQI